MDRRSLLKLAGAGALAATVPTLAGCGGSGAGTDVSNAGKNLTPWPTHVPFAGPRPDAPGNADGLQSLYRTYPQQLVRSVADKPGDGSKVTAVVVSFGAPPRKAPENQFWKAVNDALGVDLDLVLVPEADYVKKMATLMASGDLPDIMLFPQYQQFPRMHEFIASQCADLSGLLGGDNVKNYPNLANIPPYAWQGMGRIGGKLYGVPIERPAPSGFTMVNRTALDQVGAPREWDPDSYLAAAKALTGSRRWGIGMPQNSFANGSIAKGAADYLGKPNEWTVVDGAFVPTIGTAECRQGLERLRKVFAAGVVHPDALTISTVDLKTLFYNGTVAMMPDGFGSIIAANDAIKDRFELDFALGQGLRAKSQRSRGHFGHVVLKKASNDRVKLLLRVLDYLAAPFGSTEYELVNHGVEGVHFTRGSNGDIVKTELAAAENPTNVPIKYVAAGPVALYYPGTPDLAQRVYDWEKATVPNLVANPAAGLVSATLSAKGPQLDKILGDGVTAVLYGRRPLSDWDTIVAEWKSAGGEKVATELAAEYAATNR